MVTWVSFVTAANEVPGTATNIVVTDTLEGPVEYVEARVLNGDGTCEIQGRRMVCQFPQISADDRGAFFLTRSGRRPPAHSGIPRASRMWTKGIRIQPTTWNPRATPRSAWPASLSIRRSLRAADLSKCA